jgi:hypothetical protein
MRQFEIRHIAFAVLLTLPAQSAFARGHSHESHSGAYQHHRAHHARAMHHHRHHHHYRYVRRHGGTYAGVRTHDEASFQSGFGMPWQQEWQQPWQQAPQRAVRHDMRRAAEAGRGSAYSSMVAQQAAANGVPVSLVHRVIMRESRYNPRAVSKGNYGIMQIRLGTARAMGYRGSAAGLLDPNTNMTYAVRYLAGAYRAAGGNESRAVALYASGYHTARVRAQRPAQQFGYSSFGAGVTTSRRASYTPVAFVTETSYGEGGPVYRVRHSHRHRRYHG